MECPSCEGSGKSTFINNDGTVSGPWRCKKCGGTGKQPVPDDVLVRRGRLNLLHEIAAIARADSLAGDISDELSTALDALDDFDDRQ